MLATHGLPPPARWRTLWRALHARSDDELYHELIARHQEPARHYHTTQHLEEMFALWPVVERLARHPAEVEVAIWFHDAVYEPLRGDNEPRSADWASSALAKGGSPGDVAARVAALIHATRHDAVPAAGDEQVLVDLDLAILGASPERFDEYEHQVRAEFAFVPVTLFRAKRRKVLERFLARPVIYHTAPMHETRERQARENLERSIGVLSR
jgi:predicted metal-dependent HD superfamily phosphohydrolase